ncbi:MAG TPA: hypothetical protein VGM83_02020 [Devosiaceae bacterium]|jgi:hypothetical protein
MCRLEYENRIGRRVRIWLDDLPRDAFVPSEIERETYVFTAGLATVIRKCVAIEIFQPFGASFHYGLLGGAYHFTDKNELDVIVATDTSFPGQRYGDTLARTSDAVFVGGLPEYAQGIQLGLSQLDFMARPSGLLNLTCMAHGEIGSAPAVFKSLARALIYLLCRADKPASLDEAMALLTA